MRSIEPGPAGKRPVFLFLKVTSKITINLQKITAENKSRTTKKGKKLIYGYARVSTSDQETTLQIDALNRAGVDAIYQEKASSIGVRTELKKLLSILKNNDLLIVYKLDRLARSLKDLLSILEQLDKVGCQFKSLTEPIDTVSPAGRLMLNILGSVAEFERTLIRERSIAGQRAAMNQGRYPGRPRRLTDDQELQIFERWCSGETKAHLTRQYNVSHDVVKMVIFRMTRPDHPRVYGKKLVQ